MLTATANMAEMVKGRPIDFSFLEQIREQNLQHRWHGNVPELHDEMCGETLKKILQGGVSDFIHGTHAWF